MSVIILKYGAMFYNRLSPKSRKLKIYINFKGKDDEKTNIVAKFQGKTHYFQFDIVFKNK